MALISFATSLFLVMGLVSGNGARVAAAAKHGEEPVFGAVHSNMRGRIALDSSGTMCSDEFTACSDDSDCLFCTSDHEVNTTECLDVYPFAEALSTTSEFCHMLAVTFCCSLMHLEEDVALTCTAEDALAADYWSCTLEEQGCSVEDMPCYGDDAYIYFAPTSAPAAFSNDAPYGGSSETSQADFDDDGEEASAASTNRASGEGDFRTVGKLRFVLGVCSMVMAFWGSSVL